MQKIKVLAAGAAACTAVFFSAGVSSAQSVDLPAAAKELPQTKISVENPHAACSESAKVIKTLLLMASLLEKGDLKTYSQYLDDGCTSFDEGTHQLIVGKEAVLADIKRRFDEISTDGKGPEMTLTIEEPYARVTGDVAVVTFKAIKKVGGEHPHKAEARATDVFVKHGHRWKKLHCRGEWKKIS